MAFVGIHYIDTNFGHDMDVSSGFMQAHNFEYALDTTANPNLIVFQDFVEWINNVDSVRLVRRRWVISDVGGDHEALRIESDQTQARVAVGGVTAPSAHLHLAAGAAGATSAPLKLTAGTNLTAPEDGAIEYDGTHLYVSIGSTRYQLDQQDIGAEVSSFNGRTGTVTLTSADVTGVLGNYVATFNGRTGAVTLSSGDVTTALGDANIAYKDAANTFIVGPQTIQTGADGAKGVVVKANSGSQSANLQEWQDSTGTSKSYIDSSGQHVLKNGVFLRVTDTTNTVFNACGMDAGNNFLNRNESAQFGSANYGNAHSLNTGNVNIQGAGANRWVMTYQGLFTYQTKDAATNSITAGHTFQHSTTATPTAGFGSSLRYQLDSSTTANRNAAERDVLWGTATDASRAATVVDYVYAIVASVETKQEAIRCEGGPVRAVVSVLAGASASNAKLGGIIFDHYTDANNGGTAETDLYSDSVLGKTLQLNGDKLRLEAALVFTGSATSSQQFRAYYGGTLVFDTGAVSIGALTVNADFTLLIITEDGSGGTVRCIGSLTGFTSTLLAADSQYTRITGLTLTGATTLKITGTAAGVGGGSNQITAKMETIDWKPAA